MCVRTIFSAALCLVCMYAHTQTAATKKLMFEAITINEGLSQGMVTWITQDHYGFLWFATKDGLNRYDGYHFVVYRHDPSSPNSIADNYTETIFEDSKGRLWVGTRSKGLELFNRETETFQHFKKNLQDNSELEHVSSITEDKQGQIWITTDSGVVVVTERIEAKGEKPVFSFRKINHKISHVFVAQNGTVWISEIDGGLFTVKRNKDGRENIDPVPIQSSCLHDAKSTADKNPHVFAEDTTGQRLYVFTRYCILEFDEKQNTFGVIGLTDEQNVFNFFACVNKKTIWLINNFHLQQFDINTSQLTFVEGETTETQKLTGDVRFVYTDRSGIIWVGTAGFGVLKYNPRMEKFHHTDDESIHWMSETNDGKILVLKNGAYFDLFDKNKGSYSAVIPDPIVTNSSAYNYGVVEAGMQDDDGTYWICKESLLNYNAAAKTSTRYLDKPSFPIYKDKAGKIWFGGNNAFCSYDKNTKKNFEYPYPVVAQNHPYKSLQAIYQDRNGIFWLGTTAGLLRFDPVNKSWKQFKNNPRDSASLSFDLIFCLCQDPVQPDKYLWVGTSGGGLNRFDMRNEKVTRYSMKNGLANDVVYGILSDKEGNLWMSTNDGLSKFDKERTGFHNYNANDGLQGNEFNRYAFCKTTDGTLFFGGVNGFNYFDPAELNDSSIMPNVMITDFRIKNQPVSFQSKNSPLSKPVYLTDKITLSYQENMISFDFVALDFTNPGKNLYQYKLDGFDKDWISSGTNHSATYTNLDPDTYNLKIRASNSDGVWNENGRSLQLVILPPWYMTWWFRVGVIIIILSAAYAFYKYRLTQALKLLAVRNRIASDLHDEIGSNLSNIFIFSNVAQQRAEYPEETITWMRKISDYTQGSMEAMSDIVWMINPRNDRFENIIVRMRTIAAEIFEARSCRLHMQFDEKLNHLNLNMEGRKNFYLIYKEAINNIAKYADCNDVWISMKPGHEKIVLEIKDNGKGFDPGRANGGNGLLNMRKRAEMLKGKFMVTSKAGEGTSIQLSFEA